MNAFYLDLKYAKLLGSKLLNFKQKNGNLFTFSHDCENKDRSRVKERGYLYKRDNQLFMKCHHCGASHRFQTFLKMMDPVLSDEYRLEIFKERVDSGESVIKKTVKTTIPEIFKETSIVPQQVDEVLTGLVSLKFLPETHPAVKYASSRFIPKEHFDKIFFVPKFNKFASKFKESFKDLKTEYPRLLFPYFDSNGRVYAMTARSFGKEEPKYIFLTVDDSAERIYGLWKLDTSKPIIVVEGQIDSLCLDNAIAVSGADYSSNVLKRLQSRIIIVPDNDFVRNKQVANSVKKAIDMGYKISLFPEDFKYKDINEAIKSNVTKDQLHKIIIDNVKSGPEATLELIFRRKC